MLISAPAAFRHVTKVFAVGVVFTVLRVAYQQRSAPRSTTTTPRDWPHWQQPPVHAATTTTTHQADSCTPDAWNAGQWTRRDPPRSPKSAAASTADVLEFEGFEGCTSRREYEWHFSGQESEWHRFPEVAAYEWTPAEECRPRAFNREAMVRDLVEQGGWLLIGGEWGGDTILSRYSRTREAVACCVSSVLYAVFDRTL